MNKLTVTKLARQHDRITAIQQDLRRALKALSYEDAQLLGEARSKMLLAESTLAEAIGDVSVALAYLNLEGTK